ncbi:LacI family DNA-binding transcriptional regulator [Leifsonia sp. 2MCAF36]|uniref:LacI family DNA-binding transcriptional regulator n=1 Tax=Leifsonia sp. 2MCAF36 TaxID=3232988 RepID=UPI003F9B01A0
MTNTASERRVTAADIAREVGVSRATVGFVLNSTPGQTISEATRDKVIDAAQRLGYRPHLAAKALASGRSRIILLVLPDWPMEYSMRRVVEEASILLDQAGYSLVTSTPHEGGTARPLWETLQPDVVIGLLPFSPERYAEIRNSGVAAVIPRPDDTEPPGDLSFGHGPRLQVEHLLERGRRQLVFASTPDPRLADLASSRYAVAAETARAHGIEDLARAGVHSDNATDLVAAWHRSGITGVIAFNDDVAARIVGAALRLGLAVPDDLAVVGHDDSPLSNVFVPSISTIHVDDEGLGHYFAEQALNATIGTPEPQWDQSPKVSLIKREST